jgi:hypothetical protein
MATTYLSRTPSTTGSTQTGTFSAWVKKGSTATTNRLFSGFIDSSNFTNIYFRSVIDELVISQQDGGSGTVDKKTTMSFRDVNGWYHIVVAFDYSNGTAEDRIKLYVNGTRITSFSPNTNPGISDVVDFNSTSATVMIGHQEGTYFNGSMAHVHWIDGTAYDADTFGETDATTGIWKPKTAPSVTYGTNGFFLKFENSAAFGTDSSGNANNFTVNGTMTQTIDTPSNVFATMNPLQQVSSGSAGVFNFSNGNTTIGKTSDSIWRTGLSTLGVTSGKYYCELKYGTEVIYTGIVSFEDYINESSGYPYVGDLANGVTYYLNTGQSSIAGTLTSYGDSFSSGDIVGIALDLDNNYIYFSKNGTWQNSGDPTSGATGTGGLTVQSGKTYMFGTSAYGNGNTYSHDYNFGNGYFGTTAVSSAQNPDDGIGIFEYDVPTGYYALNTKAINAQEYD